MGPVCHTLFYSHYSLSLPISPSHSLSLSTFSSNHRRDRGGSRL
jgi:hypothetical protein